MELGFLDGQHIAQLFVVGLLKGVIYALFAVGIALLYRGTRSINFALGEVGTVAAYVFWFLSTEKGLPLIVGLIGGLVVAVAIGAGFEWGVVRHMAKVDRITVAVSTIGLLTALLAVEGVFFAPDPRALPEPISGRGVHIFDVIVSRTTLFSFVVLALVVVGLTTVLRRTDFGLGVLAAAQDADASRLVGVPVRRVAAFVWGTGAALAFLAIWLMAPVLGGIRPALASELYLRGLIGAVVGGLGSIQGAVAGALLLGVGEAFASDWFLNHTSLTDGVQLVFFVLVLAVLLLRPGGLFAAARTRAIA